MVPVYFSGKQYLPFATISGFNLLASVVTPKAITTLSQKFEFRDMFLLLGLVFFMLNISIAITYEPRVEVETRTSQDIQSTENLFKIDLRIPRPNTATFDLPKMSDVVYNNNTNEKLSNESDLPKNHETMHEPSQELDEIVEKSRPRPLLTKQSSAQFLLSEAYPDMVSARLTGHIIAATCSGVHSTQRNKRPAKSL